MMKPKTVIQRWDLLCKKIKADSTRRKSPGRKEARKHAALCGMKSMLEVSVAADMDKRKIKWKYEPHKFDYNLCPNWSFKKCNIKPNTYTPDFFLPESDIYLEVKGKMDLVGRKKMEAVKNHLPELCSKLCFVFGYPKNKLYATPNSSRYWQWAEGREFRWSDKYVDEGWLKL